MKQPFEAFDDEKKKSIIFDYDFDLKLTDGSDVNRYPTEKKGLLSLKESSHEEKKKYF